MASQNAAEPRLVIITVCRDNPKDLLTTCQSVSLQTTKADQHIVIDGSSLTHRPRMSEIARLTGADYHWVAPDGIYEAMLAGLAFAADADYVWFVNATDWVASPEAVASIKSALTLEEPGSNPMWLVGRTAVAGKNPHFLPMPSSGEKFVHQLRVGEIGLPHSSTVVRAKAIRDVEAFRGRYRISRDYEMGLRLGISHGPPLLIDSVLSVYDESGESAKHAWKNVLHKSEARIKNQPWWQLPAEPIRILAAGRRELLRRQLRKNPDNERLWRALGWERIDPKLAEPFWEREDA